MGSDHRVHPHRPLHCGLGASMMGGLADTSFLDAALGEPDRLGYYGRRDTPNGRSIAVIPLTFGRARLVLVASTGNPYDGW
jgi:hypothetical protein